MKLHMDNKGAVDLANNWSVGGRTRHCEIKEHFLRELKEQKLIDIDWIKGEENKADIFSKNVTGTIFDKFVPDFCGEDIYMK